MAYLIRFRGLPEGLPQFNASEVFPDSQSFPATPTLIPAIFRSSFFLDQYSGLVLNQYSGLVLNQYPGLVLVQSSGLVLDQSSGFVLDQPSDFRGAR